MIAPLIHAKEPDPGDAESMLSTKERKLVQKTVLSEKRSVPENHICEKNPPDSPNKNAEISGPAGLMDSLAANKIRLTIVPNNEIVKVLGGPCGTNKDWYRVEFYGVKSVYVGYLSIKNIRKFNQIALDYMTEDEAEGLDQFPVITTTSLSNAKFDDGKSVEEFLKKHDPDFLKKYPSH